VRQYGREKRSIIVQVGLLGYGETVQGDATVTDERMQKVISHNSEIRVIHMRPIRLGQFTTNVGLYIQVYVRVIIGSHGDQNATDVY